MKNLTSEFGLQIRPVLDAISRSHAGDQDIAKQSSWFLKDLHAPTPDVCGATLGADDLHLAMQRGAAAPISKSVMADTPSLTAISSLVKLHHLSGR